MEYEKNKRFDCPFVQTAATLGEFKWESWAFLKEVWSKMGGGRFRFWFFSTPVMQKPDHNHSHTVSCAGNTSSSPEALQWESWRWTGMVIRREHRVETSFCWSNIAAKKQLQPAVRGLRSQLCSCRYFGVMKDVSCRQLLMGLKPDACFLRGDDRDRGGRTSRLNLC